MQPRVVLVTGATAGIGEAVLRRAVAAGSRVIACGRRAERLQELAEELGPLVLALPLDVRDHAAMERALAALPGDFATIDCLVNTAGLALGLSKFWENDDADWQVMIETNVVAMLHVTRTVVRGMLERERGHVIQLGSVAGRYPYGGGSVYGGTKGFVSIFSDHLRVDLNGTPVRVTSIEPGAVETEFSVVRFRGDDQRAHKVYEGFQPLSGADVAESIWFCACQPAHVNINHLELMPVAQSAAGFSFARKPQIT